MKCSFSKPYLIFFCLLLCILISFVKAPNVYTQPCVVEDIEYDTNTQIYTYNYTLYNIDSSDIWWWGIWFSEDPEITYDDTNVSGLGFATDLEDCSTGWLSTATDNRMGFYPFVGPSSDPGFYSTNAGDYYSGQTPNIGYTDSNSVWQAVYDYDELDQAINQGLIDPNDLKIPWVGGIWGWQGANADIITSYGITSGSTGEYIIRSGKYLPEDKNFFYNTTDYWDSYYDGNTETIILGSFEGTSVTVNDPVPVALCNDITIQLDANGTASITPQDIDNGSSGGCGIASITLSADTFTCSDVGVNSVTLTVTTLTGVTNTCTASVTVLDRNADGDPVTLCDGDCKDNNRFIYPGAPGRKMNEDNDCSGYIESDERKPIISYINYPPFPSTPPWVSYSYTSPFFPPKSIYYPFSFSLDFFPLLHIVPPYSLSFNYPMIPFLNTTSYGFGYYPFTFGTII